MNIYVGNLSFQVNSENLKTMFTEFGEVESSKVITDMHSGQSKGYGFVEMPNNSEADKAIKALNGKFIEGRNIKVNPASPGGKRANKRAASKKRRF